MLLQMGLVECVVGIVLFEKYVQQNLKFCDVWFVLLQFYFVDDCFDDVQKQFEMMCKFDLKDLMLLMVFVLIKIQQKKFDEVIGYLKQYVQFGDKQLNFDVGQGYIYFVQIVIDQNNDVQVL